MGKSRVYAYLDCPYVATSIAYLHFQRLDLVLPLDPAGRRLGRLNFLHSGRGRNLDFGLKLFLWGGGNSNHRTKHVVQIGLVGTIRLVWFGLVWLCSVLLCSFRFRFGSIRFDSVWFCHVRVRFGSVRFGSVRFGSVRFGSVRLGSVRFG